MCNCMHNTRNTQEKNVMWLFVLMMGIIHLFAALCNMFTVLVATKPPEHINDMIIMDMIVAVWALVLLIKET